jgi:hypothetical protein
MSAATKAWRAEDEALLARLVDEKLLEGVWTELAGSAPPPHRRAAGIFASMRARKIAPEPIDRALAGDFAPLAHAISQLDRSSLDAPLAHHLALFFGSLADALEPEREHSAPAERARMRSIAMWLFLADEETYLRTIAERVIAGALPAAEVARAAGEAPFEAIDRLGERAKSGAKDLTWPARAALRALAHVGEAAKLAGASDRVRKLAERRARHARSVAIDDAIAPIDRALEEASTREASTPELVALFDQGKNTWIWSEKDEHVEHFLVERITPFCWERYRERRWKELSALELSILEPVDHLAHRIMNDPTHLAYAAPCAQMYVFRAETAPSFERQIELAERAVALCPTHRNGRLVLADLLVERGMRALDVALPWATGDAISKAAHDVRRAGELFPLLKRLEEAKRRLKAMGRDLDAA